MCINDCTVEPLITVKRHFYVHDKFMRICQNGPLDKYMQFYLSVLVPYA